MAHIGQITVDVRQPRRVAEFWSAALGYSVEGLDDGSIKLRPGEGVGPAFWLQPTEDDKVAKNRVHLDLLADDGDAAAEVQRLLALGARPCDVGQRGDEGFTVLADPEGNEFCVLDG